MNAAAKQGGHGAEGVKTLQLIAVDADAEAPCLPDHLPNGHPVLLPVRQRRGKQRALKAAAFFVWHKQRRRVLVEHFKQAAGQAERLTQKVAPGLLAVGVRVARIVGQEMID